MTKIELLHADMVYAMKERNKERKDAISALIQTIKKAAIDEGRRDNISDEFADKAILKEIKSVKEQIDTCPDNRADLKEQYQYRFEVMNEYAPKLMSEEEIRDVLDRDFSEVLATKNKGLIMKTVMPAFKGKADGKTINQIINEYLK